ncbi:hypothetical protein [Streptomyces noursei]|uniref:hypothetical protein n=1 Tax=Streptomyces noursei TaxID=1971 RepID=UPI001671B1E0|nr:hypothetical protein [Streptomyces noursei]MCZ1020331.1 hypothetical protein [Streptomyces noursei]GGX55157.1 hypothetical protein GCM10010341_90110 [Streptomyces noursei]
MLPMLRSVQGSETLLQYGLSTYPTELTVGYPDPVALHVTVGRGISQRVLCDGLTIRLAIGDDAGSWTTERQSLRTSVRGGTGASQGRGWVADIAADGDWQVFTFTPNALAEFDGSWDMTLAITDIRLNTQAGHARVGLSENTSYSGGTTSKSTQTTVQKAPRDFVLHSFHPEPLSVDNGEAALLKWEGTRNASYTLFWDRQQLDLDFGSHNPYGQWPTPALHQNTTFMLQAKYQENQDTYWRRLTTTVSVVNPDLEVHNLTVTGAFKTDSIAARDGDAINVENNLNVLENVQSTFRGPVVALGSLTVEHAAEMFGAAEQLAYWGPNSSGDQTFEAPTDGLVVGRLKVGSTDESGEISVTVDDVHARTAGTAIHSAGPSEPAWHQVVAPVRRGHKFTVQHRILSPSGRSMEATFQWIGFGSEGRGPI